MKQIISVDLAGNTYDISGTMPPRHPAHYTEHTDWVTNAPTRPLDIDNEQPASNADSIRIPPAQAAEIVPPPGVKFRYRRNDPESACPAAGQTTLSKTIALPLTATSPSAPKISCDHQDETVCSMLSKSRHFQPARDADYAIYKSLISYPNIVSAKVA